MRRHLNSTLLSTATLFILTFFGHPIHAQSPPIPANKQSQSPGFSKSSSAETNLRALEVANHRASPTTNVTSDRAAFLASTFDGKGASLTTHYELGIKNMSETVGRAPDIELTPCGARVPTVYQKLVGIITQEGLRLDSAESTPDSLRLRAHSIGREGGLTPLPPTGEVSVSETYVVWSRPGLNEEFSATQDGLRQDFVIHTAPDRTGGPLWVELDLCGAKAELADWGASLILNGSGRELSYSKLLVNDASGCIIPARIEVPAADRIRIVVDDADAVYPLRIDPTFSDADWITLNPTIPGTNATISALAINPLNGDVVVGGDFGYAGGASTGYIAKWNGSEWSPLGAGIGNGSVKALCFDSTGTLYAGGFFTSAGGIPAKYIAKWNGSYWSNLGSGMSSSVYSLTCDAAGNLYAGGSFTTAGGVTVNGVAKWNGSTWSALGSGMSGGSFGVVVNALVCDAGGNLCGGPENPTTDWLN